MKNKKRLFLAILFYSFVSKADCLTWQLKEYPYKTHNLKLIDQLGGEIWDVYVVGNYAYLACASGLYILDMSKISNLYQSTNINNNKCLVSKYLIPGEVKGVHVLENYAYVITSKAGLHVIDISEPSAPKEVWYHDTCGDKVYVLGKYAYVVNNIGLEIIDISKLQDPKEIIGWYYPPDHARDIYVQGTYAYIAAGEAGLIIVDISQLFYAYASEMGYYDTPGEACSLFVVGSYAYIADGEKGLRVIDISNPQKPREVGYYDTLGYTRDVYVVGNYAYVASGGSLLIIDISQPYNLKEISQYGCGSWDIREIFVSGNYAYIVDTGATLKVIDVSIPSQPILIGSYYNAPGVVWDLHLFNSYIYLTTSHGGFHVMDISKPWEAKKVRDYRSSRLFFVGRNIYVSSIYACLSEGFSIEVLDISEPTNPKEIGFYDDFMHMIADISILGTYAYVAAYSRGLRVIDISKATPRGGPAKEVGYYEGYYRGDYNILEALKVQVIGTCAYVVDSGKTLRLIDISEPCRLREVGSYSISTGRIMDIHISGEYGYIVAAEAGLRIIDLKDLSKPKEIGSYSTRAYYPDKVFISGNYAYVVDSDKPGLRVINISKPYQPIPICDYNIPGGAKDVNVSGAYVYVVASDGSLYILHHTLTYSLLFIMVIILSFALLLAIILVIILSLRMRCYRKASLPTF